MTKILFILHNKDEIIKGVAGTRVGHHNYFMFPQKRLVIISFEHIFDPYNNRGFYIDIFLRNLIRRWKIKRLENIQRKKDKLVAKELYYKLNSYLTNYILDFI